jgi:hypothetical protein
MADRLFCCRLVWFGSGSIWNFLVEVKNLGLLELESAHLYLQRTIFKSDLFQYFGFDSCEFLLWLEEYEFSNQFQHKTPEVPLKIPRKPKNSRNFKIKTNFKKWEMTCPLFFFGFPLDYRFVPIMCQI